MASGLDAPVWLYTDPLPERAKGWAPRAGGGVKLRQAWGPPEQVGAGANVGAGDDWYNDPSINTPVSSVDTTSPAPYSGTAAPSGDSGSAGIAETETFRAPASISRPSAAAVPMASAPPSSAWGGGGARTTDPPMTSNDQHSWVDTLTPDALQVSDETGIPWQALLAIPANETGWGKSVGGNNYFGIKGTGPLSFKSPTWEVQNGQRVNITDSFQGFSSPADSMRGFAQFLRDNPRYSGALDYLQNNPDDWQGFITQVHHAGYATDPQWSSKVIQIGNQIGASAPATPASPVADATDRNRSAGAANRTSQFAMGLSPGDAYAACGPAAAIAFARAYGRNPTAQEALDLARQVGWTQQSGMAGVQSEQGLLQRLGVDTTLERSVDWSHVQQEAQAGNPVVVSTTGHYFYVTGYNPSNGTYEVGSSGTDLKRGSAWMSPDQMVQTMGQINGALYAAHPLSGQQNQQDPGQLDPEWSQWSFGTGGVVEPADPSVGTGADVGAGDDWYNDPTLNLPESPPSASAVPPADDAGGGGGFFDEIGKAKDAVTSAVSGAVSGAQQAVGHLVADPSGPTPAGAQPMPSDLLTHPDVEQDPTKPEDILPDITPVLQAPDPATPLGRAVQGQRLSGPEQLAAGAQTFQGAEAAREAATEALNPARDVPVLGGIINAATDPLTFAPVPSVDKVLSAATGVVRRVAPRLNTALTRAADAVAQSAAQSAVGRVPGVIPVTQGFARAPAQITSQFALDVAGGVLGGTQAAGHIDPNDPERIPKILGAGAASAAATHTGVHFLVESGTLPAIVDAWNRVFTPVDMLTDDEKAIYVNLANKEGSAKTQGALMRERIKATLGRNDNLNWAMGHEEFGAANPLIANPEQAQLSSDMIDFTNRTGDVGRTEGFITGDVRGPSPGSPAVHFPHVYDEGMKTARAVATTRRGYSPMDLYSFQRTHTLLKDAVAAGLTPVNSVSDPYSMYVRRVLSSQAKMEFVQAAKRLPNSKNLIHVPTAGMVPPDRGALGWVSGKQWSPRMQNIAVSPDMARVLNNLYEPSRLRNTPVLGGLSLGLGEAKQILLGASGFHGGNLIRQYIGSNLQNGGDRALAGIMWHGATPAGFRRWATSNMADIVEAADWGVTLMQRHQAEGGIASTAGGAALRGAAGGAFGFAAGYNTAKDDPTKNAFEEGLKSGALGAVGAASTRIISDAVFQRYLPMMKVTTFQLMKHAAGPEAAAQYVNDAFGGQNIAAMGRSKTVQDVLRVIALAPDWQEGWVKQIGNSLKPGGLGDLNRQYWANTAVAHALVLEGMNLSLSGHTTEQNGTGHEFDLELTGLYDKMGADHTDKNTGQKYRVYASILGPYKGMLQPIVEAGQAMIGAPGHNAGTTGAAVANMLGSRVGILGQEAGALTADTDWKGAPVVPRGTNEWKAAALRVGQSFARLAPIGVQTATQGVNTGLVGSAAAFAGMRVSTMTPVQEEFRNRQQLIDQAGRTPAELETLHQQYSQQLADNDKAAQAVYSGEWKPPGGKDATHGQMDQQLSDISKQRPKYAEEINSWFPDSLFGGDAAKQRDFLNLVKQQFPGVAGSNVPADLPETASADDAYSAFFGVPQDKLQGLSPGQINSVRGKALAAWSVQNGVDYQVALDNVKAKAWGGATPPKLPDGVTSETIDSWVTQWGGAPDAQSKRYEIDKIAEHYLPGDPNGPDTVWQRIKLRMMPAQKPDEVQVSRDKALDVLFASRDKGRFPAYMDENFKPVGNPDLWAQWDQEISKAGKRRDPNINKLLEQRDRATQSRKNYVLNNVNNEDYERWFGIGKNMTEAQWQKYQTGGYPHYKDTADPQETLSRDKIEQQWQSLSKAARVNTKVVLQINGQPQPMSLENAHLHITHTISKGWAKALDIPGSPDVASQGGTNAP